MLSITKSTCSFFPTISFSCQLLGRMFLKKTSRKKMKETFQEPKKTGGFKPSNKVADLSPLHFRKQSATDGTKLDLKIGFQGLAA